MTDEHEATGDARRACEDASYTCTGDRENYGKVFSDFIDCGEIDDYDYEDCDATVAEIETCVDEFREASLTWADEISCGVGPNWRPSRQLSPSCAALVDDYDCGVFIWGD